MDSAKEKERDGLIAAADAQHETTEAAYQTSLKTPNGVGVGIDIAIDNARMLAIEERLKEFRTEYKEAYAETKTIEELQEIYFRLFNKLHNMWMLLEKVERGDGARKELLKEQLNTLSAEIIAAFVVRMDGILGSPPDLPAEEMDASIIPTIRSCIHSLGTQYCMGSPEWKRIITLPALEYKRKLLLDIKGVLSSLMRFVPTEHKASLDGQVKAFREGIEAAIVARQNEILASAHQCPCGGCVSCACSTMPKVGQDNLCVSCGGVPLIYAIDNQIHYGVVPHVDSTVWCEEDKTDIETILSRHFWTRNCLGACRCGQCNDCCLDVCARCGLAENELTPTCSGVKVKKIEKAS